MRNQLCAALGSFPRAWGKVGMGVAAWISGHSRPIFLLAGLLGLTLIISACGTQPETRYSENVANKRTTSSHCVILLHGLGRTSLSMKAVEWALEKRGYRVVNSSYPSLLHPIEDLATDAVDEGLAVCRDLGATQIDFVTHSMGGILVRQYLSERMVPELRRVVMLAPPNQGSELADYYGAVDIIEPLLPEAIKQLGTGEESVPLGLGPVDFELGVIAGDKDWLGFPPGAPDEPGDGVVSLEETEVIGMQDSLTVPATHTFIMWKRDVLSQIIYFLENGTFLRGDGNVHR